MAALLLSVAGASLGGAVFGPVGAIAGRIAGAIAGNVIDHALLAPNSSRQVEGPRLADLDVMVSTDSPGTCLSTRSTCGMTPKAF